MHKASAPNGASVHPKVDRGTAATAAFINGLPVSEVSLLRDASIKISAPNFA